MDDDKKRKHIAVFSSTFYAFKTLMEEMQKGTSIEKRLTTDEAVKLIIAHYMKKLSEERKDENNI